MKTILAIDTSGPRTFLTIRTKEGNTFSGCVEEVNSHNESLPGLLEEVLKEAVLSLPDIDLLAAAGGPGSFTGIRIGLSFLQGLACGLRIPMVVMSSHLAAASSFCLQQEEYSEILVCSEAGREELFASLYAWEQKQLQTVKEAQIVRQSTLSNWGDDAKRPILLRLSDLPCERVSLLLNECTDFPVWDVTPGLCELVAEQENDFPIQYSSQLLASIAPTYVRPVNARTIKEREAIKREKLKLQDTKD